MALPLTRVEHYRYVEAHSTDPTLFSTFRTQVTELSKQSVEARDNVKFLTTLERHFKAITHGPLAGKSNSFSVLWFASVNAFIVGCRLRVA